MENRKKYRLGEIEEIISEMEFEDRCDEIVEIDDDLQLLISGWYVVVPSLSLLDGTSYLHKLSRNQITTCQKLYDILSGFLHKAKLTKKSCKCSLVAFSYGSLHLHMLHNSSICIHNR